MNILIVNGSGAIGSSIVKGLNEHDVNLIITSSTGENVHGNKTIQWKYSGSESVEDLFNSIKSKYDQIDSAVNCLGSIFIKPAHLTSEDDFDNTINMNLKSSFLLLKHTIPMMRKNGGNLLFFSSAAANIGMVNHEAIAAAKGGVEAMVKSASATYAKNNINYSIGRIGVPKDISKFAIPLIIDNSSWVSGSVFNIDGGLSTTKIAS